MKLFARNGQQGKTSYASTDSLLTRIKFKKPNTKGVQKSNSEEIFGLEAD